MTLANHEMDHDEQSAFFEAMDRVNRAGSALKVIAWALGGLTAAGLSVAVWVLNVNWAQADHGKKIGEMSPKVEAFTPALETVKELKPRVEALEARAVRYDAAPPPSQAQFYEIDKRLDRMEQTAVTLREQNALILESLKKLEARP